MENQYYIIRSDRAGVFFGNIKQKDGQNIILANVRRIWAWEGACSISQLAVEGTKSPEKCRFAIEVSEIELFDVIEVIPCTDESVKSIKGVKVWKI